MSDDIEASSDEFLEFKCPYCAADVSFPMTEAGAVEECPYCTEVFFAPGESGAPGRQIPIPIVTPRLALRRLRPEDCGDVLEFSGEEKLYEFNDGTPMDEAAVRDWLLEDQKGRFLRQGYNRWLGIELLEKSKLIGWAAFNYSKEAPGQPANRKGLIEAFISPQFQRQGYGAEALRGLLEFGFNGAKVRRITASCDSRNVAAKALLAKVGMRLEGEFYQDRFVKGEWVTTDHFAMLAEEFQPGASA